MKSTIIEGIPDSKIKGLKEHLLEAEEKTGGKLRRTPRYSRGECPVMRFCAGRDKSGILFDTALTTGELVYGEYGGGNKDIRYKIYTRGDSNWWAGLMEQQRIAITRHIQQWIKEGKKL